ncbi:MAG: tRNA pseudouridine(38-40) synthase TruA [Planctomycetota bacterium]
MSPAGIIIARMERNIYLLTAYDGTEFHGWQNQPGLRTVQDVLEQAIRRAVRHQVNLIGSGRTDSGVHAAGHVGNFRTTCELSPSKLRHSIGSRLPKDVSIEALRDVHPNFHSTKSTVSKLYRYRIYHAERRPVERLVQRYTYHFWQPLDVDRMREGAKHFIGERDFSAMTASGGERESMVRTVFRCDVERHLDEIRIDVEGGGFLYKQVRNMVGTLMNVGRGLRGPEYVAEVLAGGDRTRAGPTVPARGLCLQWVRYPPELLVPVPDMERNAEVEATG